MEESKLKNMVILKNLTSNLVEEAIVILKENKNVLKVFIYANKDSRRARVEKVYKKDSKILEKMDKQRISYYNFHTDQKFGNAENYDICLDSGHLGIDKCANIISSIAKK